jgi:hypothetical protein
MRQKLVIAAIALLIIIAGVSVYLYNSLDSIVKNGIERFGTEITGTKVSVGSVDISLRSGKGTIRNFRVANPDGFSHDNALEFDEVTLALNVSSLNRDPIVIDEIRVKAPLVNAELDEKYSSNVLVIRDHAQRHRVGSTPTAKGKEDGGFEKHFVVRKFVMEQGLVKGDATRAGGGKREFPLPPVELDNIGGERGARPEAIGRAMTAAVFVRVTQTVGDQLRTALEERVKNKMGEILGK